MNRIRVDGGIAAIGEMFADTSAWEELVAGLPDASGEFTGYFEPTPAFQNWLAGIDAAFGMSEDACAPDTSQPYPF